jgi:hypothetical protein
MKNSHDSNFLWLVIAFVVAGFVPPSILAVKTALNVDPSVEVGAVGAAFLLFAFYSFGHVLTIGIVGYLVLKRLRWLNFVCFLVWGGATGTVPSAFFLWPPRLSAGTNSEAQWISGALVQLVIDGVPTSAMWDQYLKSLWFFGVVGAAAGVCFWVIWKATVVSPAHRAE